MNAITNAAILVEGVEKRFGDTKALQEVDLVAAAGKVFGLLGPNGAGKTTLVRILTTLLQPDRGRVLVAGIDVVRQPQRVREIIGLAGQYAAVDENLTGRENLQMVGQLYHLRRTEARKRAGQLLERFTLTDAADRPTKTYSGGMRRRLDLAASLMGHPQILLLDEPTTGLDPRTRIELWTLIRELVQEGTTLLLTTQQLEEADELADRIAVMDNGRVIAEGTADELKARLGADVLELRIADISDIAAAARALQDIGTELPQADPNTGEIRLPVHNGAQSVIEAVRQLDEANISLADLHLHRPSLDDVFLALTGRPAEVDSSDRREPVLLDNERSRR